MASTSVLWRPLPSTLASAASLRMLLSAVYPPHFRLVLDALLGGYCLAWETRKKISLCDYVWCVSVFFRAPMVINDYLNARRLQGD